MTIPADNPVTCSTVSHLTSNGGGPNTGIIYITQTQHSRANMVTKVVQTCIGNEGSCSGGNSDGTETYAQCGSGTNSGTWTWSSVTTQSIDSEFPCFFNRVQYVMTSNGGALSVGATTNMEPNFAIFYQLVLDLTSAAYGATYVLSLIHI